MSAVIVTTEKRLIAAVVLFLCTALSCLGLGNRALAAGGAAPAVQLRIGDLRQGGGLVWQEWTDRAGPDTCVTGSADGPGHYPKPLVIPGRHRARFLFRTPLKPRKVRITAWRAVDLHGNPIGPNEELPSDLKPTRRANGTVAAWRAIFSLRPPPDYYIDLYARWRRKCGGPRHLLRTYHVAAGANSKPRSVVPRHGFLVGAPSGRLRVLSRKGEVIYRVPRSVGPYGPQGIALARDRRHAFVSVLRGSPRLPHLYRVNLATGVKRRIANGISPVFSPHRGRLAYVSVVRRSDILYKAALVVRNLRTGGRQRIPLGPDIPLGTPPDNIINWSPSGRRVAFYDGTFVRLVRLGSENHAISKPVAPRGWQAPAFLDSRTIVVLANCCIGRHQRLVAVDRYTGQRHPFATLGAPPENLVRLRPAHLLAVTALYRLAMVSHRHTRVIAKGITAATR
jgi:hypothetical protein